MSQEKWYTKQLGEEIILCKHLNDENLNKSSKEKLSKLELLFERCENAGKLVIGLYFTPVNVIKDDCTYKLISLFNNINQEQQSCSSNGWVLKIIQIFLMSNAYWLDKCSLDNFIQQLPWHALPICDQERSCKLTRRYEVKSVTATLVLLRGDTGEVLTKHGRERLLDDPTGVHFPWIPRPLEQIMKEILLTTGGQCFRKQNVFYNQLKDFVVGFYFSAHWCPPCKAFTPQLVETYNRIRDRGVKFEVVFVSSDRSQDSYHQYISSMPWLAVSYRDEECRRELANLLSIQGIPTLVLVDCDGSVITNDGRGEVNGDPDGQHFPWRARLVNILTERLAAKLQQYPAVVLFIEGDESEVDFAETVLLPAAEQTINKHSEPDKEESQLLFYYAYDSETTETLREILGLDDAVPLLTLVDLPNNKLCVMEDGAEITQESVLSFVEKYYLNELNMADITSSLMVKQ